MWVLWCRSDVTREKFEELAAPILTRAMKPCEDALVKAGITAADVAAVEMVGAASRTPALVKTVADYFKQEPKRCALAAILEGLHVPYHNRIERFCSLLRTGLGRSSANRTHEHSDISAITGRGINAYIPHATQTCSRHQEVVFKGGLVLTLIYHRARQKYGV